jgi:hypothetical protein
VGGVVAGFVTTTSTGGPVDPPGVVTLITKRLLLLTTAGTPPKVTVRPVTKLVPVIVTASPPLGDPVLGETTFIFGAVETGVAV